MTSTGSFCITEYLRQVQEASASLDIYDKYRKLLSLDIYDKYRKLLHHWISMTRQDACASLDIYDKYRKLLHHWISMTSTGSFCITGYL